MSDRDIKYLGLQKIRKWYLFITLPFIALFLLFLIPQIDKLVIILFYGMEKFADGLRFANSKTGTLSDGTPVNSAANVFRYVLIVISLFSAGFLSNLIVRVFHRLFAGPPEKGGGDSSDAAKGA